MSAIISIDRLGKRYASGLEALKEVSLEIQRGEIFALLGPNGAGKTTLINAVCGIVKPTQGTVRIDGHDILREYRAARARVGLVPQEIAADIFETPLGAVRFSRGLFGRAPDEAFLKKLLEDLALWDKREAKIITLSGGMKRRVLIAKALAHEPDVLFLDEPTAGVDVKLRRDMWSLVRGMRDRGVTVILTTHYIEEAEEMADRIGVINRGELVVVEEKAALMKKLGTRKVTVVLESPLPAIPPELAELGVTAAPGSEELSYAFGADSPPIPELLSRLHALGIRYRDLRTHDSSLEEIFVRLVEGGAP